MIRWTEQNRIRHFELVHHLKSRYYNETVFIVDKIRENLCESKIKTIINSYDDSIIHPNIKELLYTFLVERRERIIGIYYDEKEAGR